MSIITALQGVRRLFLDTAPVVYFVELNPNYIKLMDTIFNRVVEDGLEVVTSPVTLAECLIYPARMNNQALQDTFRKMIVEGQNTIFQPTTQDISERAVYYRNQYNLELLDAIQFSTAELTGCDALLTNDRIFKRVTEVQVIYLGDYL